MKRLTACTLSLALSMSLLSGISVSAEEDTVNVYIVVSSTFGDRSFNDSAKEGGDLLAEEYENIEVSTIECNNENFDAQMQNAADVGDIVVCVGWEFYNVETIALDYPDVYWIWVDNETSAPVENILNITYAQNEGSFLAGYIAASMSESGVIGAVGGEDSDTINDFVVGYEQGAQYYADENGSSIEVTVNYTNDYDDPAKGKECALALNDEGADVIFQIASKAGDGVFEAAQEREFWAIGVDCDQKYIADDVIICSMKKEVGNSIYEAVVDYMEGDLSLWGTTWAADLATGYVGIGYGEEDSTQQVSDETKAKVEELTEMIVSGEIVVDSVR
ncbi:MAG: BMP family ABC transporter substrate-binding protein [Clostridiales bacterium]|nr:BMP family ABC transporter substrate-binding protein [Clostridiales bacterium]